MLLVVEKAARGSRAVRAPTGEKIMALKDWDAYEVSVDDAIASCEGDLRAALRALILVNEHLERDLQQALSADAPPSIAKDRDDALEPINRIEVRTLAKMSSGKP